MARAKAPITPLHIARDCSGLLVFGGTFDPPHLWHVAVARAAREHLFGPQGWIVFIPAARNPLKATGPVASDADRCEMLRLALRGVERCSIWTDEIDRASGSPSYTVETVARLREVLPDVPCRLLIGTDQAAEFHRWRDCRRLMSMAEPCVVFRPPLDSPAKLAGALERSGAWTEGEVEWWLERIVPAPVCTISSTEVREAIGHPADAARLERVLLWMDPGVVGYARRRGLYAGASE